MSRKSSQRPADQRFSTDVWIALALAAGTLVLYVVTLCPTIYVEDSAEFSTAAAVVGLPHPPGYPLYTLLAALFVRVVPFGDIGYRSNLLSAVFGAASVASLWGLFRGFSIGRAAALAATFCFAFGTTFWSQCLAAEVHTLNCLLLVTSIWAVSAAARRPSTRAYVAAGIALGLLVGHRNLNAMYAVALVVVLEVSRRRTAVPAKALAAFAAGGVATALLYLYLPLTAWRDPPLDTASPSTVARFLQMVTAHAYYRHLASGPTATDLDRFWHYLSSLPRQLSFAVLAAPVGFVVWRRRSGRLLPTATLGIILSCVAFAALYNVVDIDAYFLPASLGLTVLAGFGFDALKSRSRMILPFVAAAAIPLNFGATSLRGMDVARAYGADVARSAPPQAAVISFGDTATNVLGYGQAVEHIRPDIVVISFDQISDWYVEQLAHRHAEMVWPPAEAPGWLTRFLVANVGKRPVCLTHPLDLGLPNYKVVATGLLFCTQPSDAPPDLTKSVAFWQETAIPVFPRPSALDVHVEMIVFSYALSEFRLAGALAEAGDEDAARSHLRAVAAADPDRAERAIFRAMTGIGRVRGGGFDLGQRAEQALSVRPGDVASLERMLRL